MWSIISLLPHSPLVILTSYPVTRYGYGKHIEVARADIPAMTVFLKVCSIPAPTRLTDTHRHPIARRRGGYFISHFLDCDQNLLLPILHKDIFSNPYRLGLLGSDGLFDLSVY